MPALRSESKRRPPRRTRTSKTYRPLATTPECEVVMVAFEVDSETVSIIDGKFNRTALFPSERIGGLAALHAAIAGMPFSTARLVDRLREAIITVMSDMEQEDNGVG